MTISKDGENKTDVWTRQALTLAVLILFFVHKLLSAKVKSQKLPPVSISFNLWYYVSFSRKMSVYVVVF